MSRWEDTALSMPKIKKDPILALIESQTDEMIEAGVQPVFDSSEDWDSVYGDDPDEPIAAINHRVESSGSSSSSRNPIDLNDDESFPRPSFARPTTSTTNTTVKGRYQGTYSPVNSSGDKIRSLEKENAKLLAYNQELKRRIYDLENSIPGMSNHQRAYRNHGKLSATILIDGREVFVDNLSPEMSGLEFTRKVAEVARNHPGNLIVMQHSLIQPYLSLNEQGLGSRPFYAISLGDKEVEIGRSIKVKLFGPGPLI